MTRAAYLAGTWYPGNERDCRAAIEEHAAGAEPKSGTWLGLVGPHAGWMFSGDVAAQTYRWLAHAATDVDLVVIFGSHRGPHGPNTIFLDDGWESPLGVVPNAQALARRLKSDLGFIEEPSASHDPDNGVELHVPFVRYYFDRAEMLMLGIEASPRAISIGESVARLVGESGRKAVFVGSTDLTHYGPNYRFEPRGPGAAAVRWVRDENDRGFIEALLRGDAAAAVEHARQHQSACCPGAAAACLSAVQTFRALDSRSAHGAELPTPTPRPPPPGGSGAEAQPNMIGALAPKLVRHTLSYDVRPATSFVGYAGIVF